MGLFEVFGNLGSRAAESLTPTSSELAEADVQEERLEALEEATDEQLANHVQEIAESLDDARAELMMRQTMLESTNWNLIFGKDALKEEDSQKKITFDQRVRRNNAAYHLWREDPVAGRGVDTINEYVWGRGLPLPRAADPRVARLIKSFWEDEDNKLILTSYEAQVAKGTELIINGELFLVVFDQGKTGDLGPGPDEQDISPDTTTDPLAEPTDEPTTSTQPLTPGASTTPEPPPPPSAIKLAQIHPNEIVEVIPHQENSAKPLFYKRKWKIRTYDFVQDRWVDENPATPVDEKSIVKYYEDLFYEADEFTPRPPDQKLAEGKIIHVAINRTSFELRGNSELWRAVRWSKALNDFFNWRLTLLRALSTFIFRKKVKGGMSQLQQAATRGLGSTGRTGLPGDFDPLAPPAPGSMLIENQNESMEQFKTTSGAGEAEQDGQMLRGQVGVALGLPIHYLGDKGSANLANATAMEVPVLKMMEARQELFEQLVTKILNYCIDKAIADGKLPEDIDRTFYVEMPNIMQRNIPELVATLTNMTARLDPFAEDVKLKRLTLQQTLMWLGFPDPDAIVRHVYPPGLEQKIEAEKKAQAALENPDADPAAGGNLDAAKDTGISGTAGGTPEKLKADQPFPGANTGVTKEQPVA